MFKTTLACRSFLLFTLQDFFLVCMLSMYVCMLMFQKLSPCGGFSKALSLWRVSDCEACMYVCMYAKHVCMHVRASGSTPPHKSQKIELNVQYWRFSVRNRTQPWDDDLRSQTYVCMYVCMLSLYVCMLGHLEVPPLTNLKKMNYRSNTKRFS